MPADNSQLENVLSGAFLEIAVVTDLGETSESETVVGFTMGETTITSEDTTTEFQLHESRYTQTFNEHENLSMEFVLAMHAGMDAFETLGIVDSNGNVTGRSALDLRIRVYDDEPADAGSADQVIELYRCETNWNEMTLPQDGSEVTMQVDINGGYQLAET